MIAKFELWAGCVLAVLAGIGVAILYGYEQGKQHAAAKVAQVQARAKASQVQTQVTQDAAKAVQAVQAKADAQPAPDAAKRDDLDNTTGA